MGCVNSIFVPCNIKGNFLVIFNVAIFRLSNDIRLIKCYIPKQVLIRKKNTWYRLLLTECDSKF